MHSDAPGKAAGLSRREEAGHDNGPGVLWVHGYTIDSSLWSEIWRYLPGYRHHGVDLPGHGAAPPVGPDTTLESVGAQIANMARAHGLSHVVGLSLGTVFVVEAALQAPHQFSTVTLAAPAFGGGPVDPAVAHRFKELRQLYLALGNGPWMTALWMRSPPELFAHSGSALAERLACVIDRHDWTDLRRPGLGLGGLVRSPQNIFDLRECSSRFLTLIGEHELGAFVLSAHLIRAAAGPSSVEQTLAGAGHLCLLQQPEEGARILRRHWTSPLSDPGPAFSPQPHVQADCAPRREAIR